LACPSRALSVKSLNLQVLGCNPGSPYAPNFDAESQLDLTIFNDGDEHIEGYRS
jgi:hypothetical protein